MGLPRDVAGALEAALNASLTVCILEEHH